MQDREIDLAKTIHRIRVHREGHTPAPTPPWATFLLTLGTWCVNWEPDRPAVIALSLPTVSFAAPLLAAGAVLATINRKVVENQSPESKFDQLCETLDLPVSFTVTLPDGRLVMRTGVTAGSGYWKKRHYLRIRYYEDEDGLSYSRNIYLDDISSVHRLEVEKVDLTHRQRGTTVTTHNKFMTALLGEQRTAELTTTSLPICVVVTNKSGFVEECESETFAETDSGSSGALIDLVRPNTIPRYASTSRTLLYSASVATLPEQGTLARVLILVGNKAAVRHALAEKFPFTILLLDRAERDYEAAEDFANNLYAKRSSSLDMSFNQSATMRLMAFHR